MAASASVDAAAVVERLRATFATGRTKTYAWRHAQLTALKDMLVREEARFLEALHQDLHKSSGEAVLTEMSQCFTELDWAMKNLAAWMKPRAQSAPNMLMSMDTFQLVYEPVGTVLIATPWNFAVILVIGPLISSIAAGNCTLLKPSEISENTSRLIAELVPLYLDNDAVQVIVGGVPETTALLTLRFDHISYTGSTAVGRIFMAAAAKHLTPVTLELGGKSPVFIARDSDLTIAARRVMWGKCINAGQACIAPDYVLISPEQEEAFVTALQAAAAEFLGPDPTTAVDFGRIINERHFDRVLRLIEPSREGVDFVTVCGGAAACDRATRFIPPTILRKVSLDAAVMNEEIFGPVLPIITVGSPEEAIAFINAREKPLALYIFSNSKAVQQAIIGGTSSGGVCVNDTMVHHSAPTLPFGGVGQAGMGAHHGEFGFESFSHRRAVLIKAQSLEGAQSMRYPPYDDTKTNRLKWALGYPGSSLCSIQ